MPRGDGTGPAGMGPMTGRAAGYCAGYSTPGFSNPIAGGRSRFLGLGSGGYGRGRGFRNWYRQTGMPGWSRYNAGMPAWGGQVNYYPEVDPGFYENEVPAEESAALKQHAEFLKAQLSNIEKRLLDLEKNQQKPEKK